MCKDGTNFFLCHSALICRGIIKLDKFFLYSQGNNDEVLKLSNNYALQ